MVFKLIDATGVKPGTAVVFEDTPCIVKSIDISKTGKHGASKVRIEAVGIFDSKKKVIVIPGHERFEIPLINKRKGQVLAVQENKANIMDLESFETFDNVAVENELGIKENDNIEYWEINGQKIIKRKA